MGAGTTNRDEDQQHEAIREQLGAYAFDDLSPDERALVRDHLAGCAECRAELAELRAALAALPLELDEMIPPPGLRDRIEAAVLADLAASGHAAAATGPAAAGTIPGGSRSAAETGSAAGPSRRPDAAALAGDRTAPPGVRSLPARDSEPPVAPTPIPLRQPSRLGGGWLAAAALLLISLGLLGWNLRLRDELAEPPATVVALAPEAAAPDAGGEVTIEPAEGLIMLDVHGLPPLPEGMVYQAWLIGPASPAPVPAGTFAAPDARHAITADMAEGWTTLAITAEPGPLGMPEPTGDVVATAPLA